MCACVRVYGWVVWVCVCVGSVNVCVCVYMFICYFVSSDTQVVLYKCLFQLTCDVLYRATHVLSGVEIVPVEE